MSPLMALLGALQALNPGDKVAYGTMTPITASDTVVTGLDFVNECYASQVGAVDMTHMFTNADPGDQAGTPAAGSILIVTRKPTGAADVTPIASTTPWNVVHWMAIEHARQSG